MAKRDRKFDKPEMDMDLTPMIDIVFQLIIFFMLVSEMTTADLAQLALPEAKNATKPEGQDKKVLTVNIQKKGKRGVILIRGRKFTTPRDAEKLRRFLGIEAKAAGMIKNTQGSNYVSELKVLVRCDRDAQYGLVQDVFEACTVSKPGSPGNGIWKIAVGATEPAAGQEPK